ncbi:MAG: class I SAM-dependent methyltransferase [Terriglobales bacterium]
MSPLPSQSAPAASFRDPAGQLFRFPGRIVRAVLPEGAADLNAFLASAAARRFTESGSLVPTEVLSPERLTQAVGAESAKSLREAFPSATFLEHEAIPFPSFPYEWPPEMLHSAAALTLDLAEALREENLGLKDGTPYNVLFRGSRPIFVDVISVERREPGDATWLPYAQFVRTFLLPLAAAGSFGLPLDQSLLGRRDGLKPEDLYRLSGPLRRLMPPLLTLVTLPTWLGARQDPDDHRIYQKKLHDDPEKARYILRALFRGLRKSLRKVAPRPGKRSAWSEYMAADNNYSSQHFAAKQAFVEAALKEFQPRRVLDVGANTGHFSALSARAGARVVAVDSDPVVAGEIWRKAQWEKLDVLPLVVNLARPTPATGWRNRECPAFLDRARGGFDAVLLLAVIHHMLVSERIPLPEILSLAAELSTNIVVAEYVDPQDSMFRRLVRGREHLHRDLAQQVFEDACRAHFEIVRSQQIEGTHRRLYLLRRSARA